MASTAYRWAQRRWCIGLALLGALAMAMLVAAPPAPAADCPGAVSASACPYTAVSQIGQRGGGVMRFPQTVAIGPDGSVYVGDQSSGIVQVFSADGTFQREIGVAGLRPGELGAVGAVAVAPDNTVFVADGTSNRINRFAAGGELLSAFGARGTAVGQFHFGAGGGNDSPAGGGLAATASSLFVSDSFNDRVQRFRLDGSDATAIIPPGLLANPRGLAVRKTRLVVADDHNHRLAVFDTNGRLLRTVGRGQGAGLGQLNFPFGVAIDAAGRVFVADDINQRVVRFGPQPDYPYKARWGSYGTGPGQLAFPRGIAVDGRGYVYVTNTGNDRIDVFDRNGALLRSFGASGRGPGQFNAPLGISSDANGYRAVVDSINGRVEFLYPDGTLAAIWGSPSPGPTILRRPVAVSFDAAGDAYVLDQRRPRIVVFSRATGLQSRFFGAAGDGPGRMTDPSAMAIDGAGQLYVADTGNQRVVRFTSAGEYLGAWTGAGNVRGIAVTPDGTRTYVSDTTGRITVYGPDGERLAQFGGRGRALGKLSSPGQLALDAAGNLWVADRGNNRIQQFGPNGERLGMFGERGIGLGQFINPTGIHVDCNGALTVSDTKNNRVQQFTLANPAVPPCTALPPIANPPIPRAPTLPPPIGPDVTLTVLRARLLFAAKTIPLRVGCDTVCTLTATATLTERSKPRKRKRAVSVSLKPVTIKLPAGERRTLTLKLSRAQIAQLRKAMKRRRGLTATLTLEAVADAGDPTTVTKTFLASG